MVGVAVAGCKLPEWRGDIPPVVAREDPCGSGAVTPAGTASIHRHPYLQSPIPTGVTVAWAGVPADAPRVVVSQPDDKERTIADVAGHYAGSTEGEHARRLELEEAVAEYDDTDVGGGAADGTDEGPEPPDADELYPLAAELHGLSPDDAYCYRIESRRGVLTEWASLTLAPLPDDERVEQFVVIGDSGNGSQAQLAIARHVMNVPMDAILFVGDIAYKSGTFEELQSYFFEVYRDLFARVPVYAAIGNHDNRTDRGRPFEEVFVLPGNERWYSFESGDVHFVVLDTTQIGRSQAQWLEQDLAHNARRFTVVLAHHPPFTAARRGPNRGFQRWFVPILERHRVELVITGHEHHYERLRPINGVRYVVTGGGGGRLMRARTNEDTQVAVTAHHYVTLAAKRDELVVTAIGIDGQVIDELVVPDR